MSPAIRPTERKLEQRLLRAFAPLDARALGLSIGIVAAVALSVVTMLSMAMDPAQRFPLELLRQFFPGYSRSLAGGVLGALWAFVTGFIIGWILCAARNMVMAFWLLKARVRSDIQASHDVLDQF